MFDISTLLFFCTTTIIIGLTPDPVTFNVVARSLQGGTSQRILSSLSAGVGGLVHAFAATLGLSALVLQSVIAFCVLKYFGAAYLIYLGVRT